uniref:Uncharacterized protein n=1 Tax=Glossina palpalis gambiensis TaxID=67801 RepID=A0A1B0BF46_9MUSC
MVDIQQEKREILNMIRVSVHYPATKVQGKRRQKKSELVRNKSIKAEPHYVLKYYNWSRLNWIDHDFHQYPEAYNVGLVPLTQAQLTSTVTESSLLRIISMITSRDNSLTDVPFTFSRRSPGKRPVEPPPAPGSANMTGLNAGAVNDSVRSKQMALRKLKPKSWRGDFCLRIVNWRGGGNLTRRMRALLRDPLSIPRFGGFGGTEDMKRFCKCTFTFLNTVITTGIAMGGHSFGNGMYSRATTIMTTFNGSGYRCNNFLIATIQFNATTVVSV